MLFFSRTFVGFISFICLFLLFFSYTSCVGDRNAIFCLAIHVCMQVAKRLAKFLQCYSDENFYSP